MEKAPSGRELAPKATEGECVSKRFYKLFGFAGSFRHFLAKMPPPSRREADGETRLRVASNNCMARQANLKRTCAQPVVLGLCPKMKYPPLYGGIFIFCGNFFQKVSRKHKIKHNLSTHPGRSAKSKIIQQNASVFGKSSKKPKVFLNFL